MDCVAVRVAVGYETKLAADAALIALKLSAIRYMAPDAVVGTIKFRGVRVALAVVVGM